jgi:hypothetical protein
VQVDELEEHQYFFGAMARLGVVDDLARRDVHCGEQIGRPVAFVVVRQPVSEEAGRLQDCCTIPLIAIDDQN